MNKIGIIKHRELEVTKDGKGSESIKVLGYTMDYLFGYRITYPPSGQAQDSISSDGETVIKHYINNCMIIPDDINRKIPLFNLTENQKRGSLISYSSRFQNLSDELEKIRTITETGIEVRLNYLTKKIDVDIFEGKDLTVNQHIYNPVIFSHEFDNISSQHFTDSQMNYKNCAYIGGQGEGVDRTIIEIGTFSGIDRIEAFVDARDLSDVQELQNRGEQKLKECSQVKTFEGQVLTYNPFKYQIDYDLGDIVTIVNNKWGITMNTRISEVKEIYEKEGFTLEITFGNNTPTLKEMLKTKLSSINV